MNATGPGRLMGLNEIRERLGVSRQRAQQITGHRDFPLPYQRLAMGFVWLAADVEAWIRERRPELTGDDQA